MSNSISIFAMTSNQPYSSKEVAPAFSTKRSKSIVWKLFKIDEDGQSKAICSICNIKISRGPKPQPAFYTTTNMLKHLTITHKKELEKQKKVKENNEKVKRKTQNLNVSVTHKKIRLQISQPNIHEAFSKTKIWDINDQRAQKIHRLIGKMIAV